LLLESRKLLNKRLKLSASGVAPAQNEWGEGDKTKKIKTYSLICLVFGKQNTHIFLRRMPDARPAIITRT